MTKLTKKDFPRLNEFIAFINERWSIHVKRKAGLPPPWTKDEILKTYSFTNVRREDDRVTRWVHENWLRPHASDPELWFAMYVARVFNSPETLTAVGWPVPWTAKRSAVMLKLCALRKEAGSRIFNGAYIVSSHGRGDVTKSEYYAEVFDEIWRRRNDLRPTRMDTCASFFSRLITVKGIGGFMAAQVVADLRWAPPLKQSLDWETFARSGPGSRKGLAWVMGQEPRTSWPEKEWYEAHMKLRELALPRLAKELRGLDASNLQNCECEYSKICRVQYQGGRAKKKFKPSEEVY